MEYAHITQSTIHFIAVPTFSIILCHDMVISVLCYHTQLLQLHIFFVLSIQWFYPPASQVLWLCCHVCMELQAWCKTAATSAPHLNLQSYIQSQPCIVSQQYTEPKEQACCINCSYQCCQQKQIVKQLMEVVVNQIQNQAKIILI